jgi:threonine 3-dehydrogenase
MLQLRFEIMKALVKDIPTDSAPWPVGLRLEDRPIPENVGPDEVLIKVVAAGICGTDSGIYHCKNSLRNEMIKVHGDSVIIGHEFCGRIQKAGIEALLRLAEIVEHDSRLDPEIESFVRGRSSTQLVADSSFLAFLQEHFIASAEMHITCGWCYQCRLGDKHVCRNTVIKGVHSDGAFAEYVKVPGRNLVLFRAGEIPTSIIAFMDAIGNAVHTVQSANLVGQNVVILGAGTQGVMATAIAHRSGASRIYVTDFSNASRGMTHEKVENNRFALAKRFGAAECFDLALPEERERMKKRVMEDTNGTGADVALEMSGSYSAYRDAFDLLRMGGEFVLLGIPEGEVKMDFARDVIFRGLTIRGVIGRRVFQTWEVMRNMLSAGLAKEFLDSGFVSRELPLEQYDEGFAALARGEALKVILKP